MAGLKETDRWEAEIYRIEESDPVHGGEEGVTNKPTKQLANRTLYLKKLLEAAGQKLNPKTLTATTTNHADATGHTHEIAHGSTTQKGIWQATSDTGLDSEQLVLTAKAGKNLAQQIAQNAVAMQGYIPNSKKSSSVSDNSEDKVATSKAAKTAYDKGVEALNKANELDRTALKNSGTQVLNGLLRSNNPAQGGWSGMQYGANSGFWQMEFHPAPTARENRRGNIFFQDANGTRSYLGIPHFESGDIIAYQSWVNSRIDSRIQGVIKAAPSSLDTLQEFAEALGNDPNFSATVLNKIDENKRAAQAAQNAANAANDNANGRIPNSKKSSAINSTSNDTVATSAAVKTAFDKGATAQTAAENAQRSANNANNNANGRVAKAGDEMTGDLAIRNANSDWSKVRLFNRSGKEMRMESTPDTDGNFFGVSYRSAQGTGEHSATFPKSGLNKIVAYQDWVDGRYVTKAGDTMTGDLIIRAHNSDFSKVRLFNREGKEVRAESVPDDVENFFSISYRDAQGEAEHSVLFPKQGKSKTVAYEEWVNGRFKQYVPKSGDEINWLTIKRELATLYVKSTNNPLAAIDLTVQNGKHPQVSFIAQDRGRWAVDAEIWTTPDGENYEHNRRQLHTKFHSDGNIWNKNYGWLHEKFIQRGDFVRTWYPNHYRGAEVYKIRHLNLMIIVMEVGSGNAGIYNLPEAFDGFAIPMITDNGGARNVGARMEGNNQVYLYGGNTISRAVMIIGSKNV